MGEHFLFLSIRISERLAGSPQLKHSKVGVLFSVHQSIPQPLIAKNKKIKSRIDSPHLKLTSKGQLRKTALSTMLAFNSDTEIGSEVSQVGADCSRANP